MISDIPLTYICIENYSSTIPDNSIIEEFKVHQLSQLKEYLNNNKDTEFILLIDSLDNELIFSIAQIAFKFCQKFQVNGFKYDFTEIGISGLKNFKELLVLIDQAKDFFFFETILNKLVLSLSRYVPIMFNERKALDIVAGAFLYNHRIPLQNKNKTIRAKDFAISFITQFFSTRKNRVKKLISAEESQDVIRVELDFKAELIEFIGKNPGVIVLDGYVGSGKTKDGIIPCFEYFCDVKQKPILITPFIALTQKLIDDDRNYKVAQEKNVLNQQPGIASCVDTVTTKRAFIDYIEMSNVALIDEYEECINAFTQQSRAGGSLESRILAIKEFFKLLSKPQVIIADALFSDLSAKQIVRMTEKKVFLLTNTNTRHYDTKEINIIDESQHTANLIKEREEGKSIALFNDSSQKKKNKSLALFKTVTGGNKDIGENVNAKFLKTKRGKDYLINIEERLQSIQVHQFSPSITSGHSFENAKMDSVNILSSKTILPTQVIQSASRFRLNNQISLSFNNPFMLSDYETDLETIKENLISEEVVNSKLVKRDELLNCEYFQLITERVKHNNLMRNDHCSNTILMFEMLGCEVNYSPINCISKKSGKQSLDEGLEAVSFERLDRFTDNAVSEQTYQSIISRKHWCSPKEDQNKEVYEFINQYGLNEHRLLIDYVLEFDRFGEGFKNLINYKLLSGGKTEESRNCKIKQLFFKKMIEILKLSSDSLSEVWYTNDLKALIDFFQKRVFIIDGVPEPIATLFKVFPYTKISVAQPLSTVKSIFKQEFGLKIDKIKLTKIIDGERPYKFRFSEPEKKELLLMSDLISDDLYKSKLSFLKLYIINFPDLPRDFVLNEEEKPNIEDLERKLQLAKAWAEDNYDYPVAHETLKIIDECSSYF
ncbi:hypothetical protein NBRC116592_17010 [Colwellia sp. KU-HH00111]|uniref:hypothetical protein n=1 Tax=Colwellia sp. KU-HH00111 TaxID=3127652 RepID=UPI003107C4E9